MKHSIYLLVLLLCCYAFPALAQQRSLHKHEPYNGEQIVNSKPLSIVLSVSSLKNVSCKTGEGGWVILEASPSDSNYLFSKNGTTWKTSSYFPNLETGTYTFYLKNTNNNFTDQLDVEIGQIHDLEFGALLPTNPKCRNDKNGFIEIKGGDYVYSIFPNRGKKGDKIFTNLGYGTYNITATDADGCMGTKTTNIYNPDTLVIRNLLTTSATNVHCYGTLEADGFGGSKPLAYTIAPNIGQQTSDGFFEGLCGNTYTATVTDSKGCTVSEKFIIAKDGEAPENIFDLIEVYPNPADQTLQIKSAYLIEYKISLLNATGKVVLKESFYSKNVVQDLSSLPSGIYLMHLESSVDEDVRKLVIQH